MLATHELLTSMLCYVNGVILYWFVMLSSCAFLLLWLEKSWLIESHYLDLRHHGVAEPARILDIDSSRKHNTSRIVSRIPALQTTL